MNSDGAQNLRQSTPSRRRAYWELTIYFAVIACCAFGSTFASQLVLGRGWSEASRWLVKCLLVMISVCAATSYFLGRNGESWNRFRVEWSSRAAASITLGLFCGVLTAIAWAALVWIQAPFRLERNPSVSMVQIIMSIVATFAIGIGEEVGYRSYGMEQARRAAGLAGALLIPTSIFVSMHFAGGMPLLAALLVVGSCSLLYGVLMIVTNSLPLVAAFHIGNNLVQDWILRPSPGSLWQVRFLDTDLARHSAMRIWCGIALINLSIIAAIAWRSRILAKNLAQ